MAGVFDLRTPADLLAKLRREFDRLRAAPLDADVAFNLFVTAEHLLDWIHPGPPGKAARSSLRNGNVLLQVASAIANGAKHFDHLSARHGSVASTGRRRGGMFPGRFFPARFFPGGAFGPPERLVVGLSGDAAVVLGPSIDVLALAERVVHYWSEPGRVPA